MNAISVVIPCYNCAETIEETVQSVLDQTFKNYEIIIVDDGSVDNSLEIIRKINSNINIIEQKNHGVSSARNKGVFKAKNELIAFLDGDDKWHPDKLQIQFDIINSGYDMVHCIAKNFGQIGEWTPLCTNFNDVKQGHYFEELFLGNFIITSSVILKKSFFLKCGGFDESINHCEDWDLWLKYAKKNKIFCVNKPLVYYRVTSCGLSSATASILNSGIKVIISNSFMIPFEDRKKLIKKSICNMYLNACWRYLRDSDHIEAFKCSLKAVLINPFYRECWKWLPRIIISRLKKSSNNPNYL